MAAVLYLTHIEVEALDPTYEKVHMAEALDHTFDKVDVLNPTNYKHPYGGSTGFCL